MASDRRRILWPTTTRIRQGPRTGSGWYYPRPGLRLHRAIQVSALVSPAFPSQLPWYMTQLIRNIGFTTVPASLAVMASLICSKGNSWTSFSSGNRPCACSFIKLT
jgi:hypothetical protein